MKKRLITTFMIISICAILYGCAPTSDSTSASTNTNSSITANTEQGNNMQPVEEEEEKPLSVSPQEQKELCDLMDAYCCMLQFRPGTYTPTAQNATQYWTVIYNYVVNGRSAEDEANMIDVYMEEWGVNQPYLKVSEADIKHASRALFSDFSSVPSMDEASGVQVDGDGYLFIVGDRGAEEVKMAGFECLNGGKAVLTLELYVEGVKTSRATANLILNDNVDTAKAVPFYYAIETIEIEKVN
jgi:hypothetical protein